MREHDTDKLNRKQNFRVLMILLFISAFGTLCGFAGNIVYPWRATTAIVKNETHFNILFQNTKSLPIDSVCIVSRFYSEKLKIDAVETGRFEYDHYTNRTVNNRLSVSISVRAPEELYDLYVHCGGEVHRSPKSVKVVKDFNRSHSFIHISDLHMTRQWEGLPEDGYAKELELFDRFIEVANIISPDFILITGDNIMEYTMFGANESGWGGERVYDADKRPLLEEKYKNLFWGSHGFSGIYGLNAPTFLIPGNHDFHGMPIDAYLEKCHQWNDMMGKRLHGFLFAGTRIILADDSLGDPEHEIPGSAPLSGLQGKVHEAFLQENGPGSLRILAQHKHSPIDTAFLNRNRINILVNGHNHSPNSEIIGTTPTHHSRPGVVCRSGEIKTWEKNLGFFRIFYIDDDSFHYTEPLRFCENPISAYEDIILNLTVDFEKPDDGSQVQNTILIRNAFPVNLENCKVRAVMKIGTYRVTGGVIDQTIDAGEFSVLDILFDVSSGEEKRITISPVR